MHQLWLYFPFMVSSNYSQWDIYHLVDHGDIGFRGNFRPTMHKPNFVTLYRANFITNWNVSTTNDF